MNNTQCRMARAALNWSVADLARSSGYAVGTITKFETGGSVLPLTVETLRQCFVSQGVEFIDGGSSFGVRVPRRD